VRPYGAQGVAAVIYDAGPRTALERNAKLDDEHLVLYDLRMPRSSRALFDLLQ
jgi:hypothetical protein